MGLALLLTVQAPEAGAEVTGNLLGLGFGWGEVVRAILILLIGFPILSLLSRWARTTFGRRSSAQHGLVAGKAIFYPGAIILMVSVLGEMGFGLTPILGAAGVLGIAIGFASQTSVSNIISGLFLIAERPFQVDDVIQVGTTMGRVLSIDTLSIKLRTFDNRYVRIPNETIVKSEVVTITRFPIRRLDLPVGVAYETEVSRVRGVLLDVAARNPSALMEPPPVVFFDGYGDSALNLRLGVWVVQEKYLDLKNSLLEEIKGRFDVEGIEIPFPHRTLGLGTQSIPVHLVPAPGSPEPPPPSSEEDPR